jgi:hypothetical protein
MSNSHTLREWLAGPRAELVAAVAEGVRKHVADLRSRGVDFYGYALLPGEFGHIKDFVVAINAETDIDVPASSSQHAYYRYSVDEWACYEREHEAFLEANSLIAEENRRFSSVHQKAGDQFLMDEFEIAHAMVLIDSIVQGLELAKARGAFGKDAPLLVVWISDSDMEIIFGSVRRLNSSAVAGDFIRAFDSDRAT